MCDLYQRFTDLDICMSMSIVNLHICLIMTQNKFLSFIKNITKKKILWDYGYELQIIKYQNKHKISPPNIYVL